MDKVTTDMRNELAKRSPWIKLMRFFCNTKGSDLDIMISPGINSSFEFCISLPQHSWDSALDEIQVLKSLAKVLHFQGSSRKSTDNAAPHNPEG